MSKISEVLNSMSEGVYNKASSYDILTLNVLKKIIKDTKNLSDKDYLMDSDLRNLMLDVRNIQLDNVKGEAEIKTVLDKYDVVMGR